MGIRFRRRVKIAKGVNLNLSKTGIGISGGVRGARLGSGPRGAYRSLGIPGTGLYMIDYGKSGQKTKSLRKNASSQGGSDPASEIPAELSPPMYPFVMLIVAFMIIIFLPQVGVPLLILAVYLLFKNGQSDKSEALRLYKEGLKHYKEQQFSEAGVLFEKVLALIQNVPKVLLYAGDASFQAEKFTQAAAYFEKYLQGNPTDYGVQIRYAVSLQESGDKREAMDILYRLPDEIRDIPAVYNAIASIFLHMEKYDEAIALLTSKMGRKRKMTEDLMMSRYLMGRAYKGLGDPKRALKELKKVYAEDIYYQDVAQQIGELEGEPEDER